MKIIELEMILKALLSNIKEHMGDDIILNHDYYWNIPLDEMYNPYQEPINIGLGQLSEDIEYLKKMNKESNYTSYDLKRIASIFNALSIENQDKW